MRSPSIVRELRPSRAVSQGWRGGGGSGGGLRGRGGCVGGGRTVGAGLRV